MRDFDETTVRLHDLCIQYLRAPVGTYRENGVNVAEFDPPLTAEEQVVYSTLLGLARSDLNITPDDFATIRTNLQTLRDLRQMGRAAFMALTAAERDRLIYDALVADTVIWLAVLRD